MTRTGVSWSPLGAYRVVCRLARDAGDPYPERLRPHALRHTALTLALDSGANLVDVQDSAGGAAVFIASDLAAAPDDLRAFAAAVTDALDGHVDIVVHNAALCPAVDTPGLTEADLEATLAVNIRALHVLTAALTPPMAERIVIGFWMAATVAWVASDHATFVHGATIPVDGGITATRLA